MFREMAASIVHEGHISIFSSIIHLQFVRDLIHPKTQAAPSGFVLDREGQTQHTGVGTRRRGAGAALTAGLQRGWSVWGAAGRRASGQLRGRA
jgi:hypothetical protein